MLKYDVPKPPHPEMARYIEMAAEDKHRYLPGILYVFDGKTLTASYKLPYRIKDPDSNGRYLCGWCGGPVPIGRKYWCCQGCAEQFIIRRGSSWLQIQVKKRDHGICAECGIDTEEIERLRSRIFFKRASWEEPPMSAWLPESREASLKQWGPWKKYGALWEADHIVPVIEGGGCCGLENLRTLCLVCHARETKALAGRRAKGKRSQMEITYG